MRRTQAFGLHVTAIGLAVLLSACIEGPVAHADLFLTIRNDASRPVTVRWQSADLFGPSDLALVDGGAETVNGVDAGTYTLSVDGETATARLTVARSTGDPKTSLLVVNDDLSLNLQ